jgi:hypothetical protein
MTPGAESVTVIGSAALAVETAAVVADVTLAVRFTVDSPAATAELPVNVSVQATAPLGRKVGALQEAVNPIGSPEAISMLGAPMSAVMGERGSGLPRKPVQPRFESSLVSKYDSGEFAWIIVSWMIRPPTGVAVKVTVAVASDCMETSAGETLKVSPGVRGEGQLATSAAPSTEPRPVAWL